MHSFMAGILLIKKHNKHMDTKQMYEIKRKIYLFMQGNNRKNDILVINR